MSADSGISWVNGVDRPEAVLSASSQAGDLSIQNVAHPIIGRRWRTTDPEAWGQVAFGTAIEIGLLCARFPRDVALPLAGTVRHTLDPVGGTPGAGALYDSGTIPLNVADGYGYHVHFLPAPVTAGIWRIAFAASGVSFLDVGRLWAGPFWMPGYDIAFGYGDEWMDLSQVTASRRSGAEFVDPAPRQRLFAFGLEALSEGERDAVREMQRLVGLSRQLVFCKTRAEPARETILGRMQQSTPILHRFLPVYSKAFSIRESL